MEKLTCNIDFIGFVCVFPVKLFDMGGCFDLACCWEGLHEKCAYLTCWQGGLFITTKAANQDVLLWK